VAFTTDATMLEVADMPSRRLGSTFISHHSMHAVPSHRRHVPPFFADCTSTDSDSDETVVMFGARGVESSPGGQAPQATPVAASAASDGRTSTDPLPVTNVEQHRDHMPHGVRETAVAAPDVVAGSGAPQSPGPLAVSTVHSAQFVTSPAATPNLVAIKSGARGKLLASPSSKVAPSHTQPRATDAHDASVTSCACCVM